MWIKDEGKQEKMGSDVSSMLESLCCPFFTWFQYPLAIEADFVGWMPFLLPIEQSSTERSQPYKADKKITPIKKGPDPSKLINARNMLNNQCVKFQIYL